MTTSAIVKLSYRRQMGGLMDQASGLVNRVKQGLGFTPAAPPGLSTGTKLALGLGGATAAGGAAVVGAGAGAYGLEQLRNAGVEFPQILQELGAPTKVPGPFDLAGRPEMRGEIQRFGQALGMDPYGQADGARSDADLLSEIAGDAGLEGENRGMNQDFAFQQARDRMAAARGSSGEQANRPLREAQEERDALEMLAQYDRLNSDQYYADEVRRQGIQQTGSAEVSERDARGSTRRTVRDNNREEAARVMQTAGKGVADYAENPIKYLYDRSGDTPPPAGPPAPAPDEWDAWEDDPAYQDKRILEELGGGISDTAGEGWGWMKDRALDIEMWNEAEKLKAREAEKRRREAPRPSRYDRQAWPAHPPGQAPYGTPGTGLNADGTPRGR